MRDMLSAGVAGAATGTPMHRMTVAWVRTAVNKHFASTVLRPENISNLMAVSLPWPAYGLPLRCA